MFSNFSEFAPESRVWVFLASEPLTAVQQSVAIEELHNFCDSWLSHGNPVKASFHLAYKQIFVVVADEHFEAPSGCSIDKLHQQIQQLEQDLHVELLNRSLVGMLYPNAEHLEIMPLNAFKKAISEGAIPTEVKILNPAIVNKLQLENDLLLPLSSSWAGKLVKDLQTY